MVQTAEVLIGQAAGFQELRSCWGQAKGSGFRSMASFAEEEILLPGGKFADEPYRIDRQPFVRWWFGAVDSGMFREFWATGPTQSGKTLSACVIPAMYHLFERKEPVIYGVPTEDMGALKWETDIEPAILRSRYRELLPRSGGGSKGGFPGYIKFRNGATLHFMGALGSDAKRSGATGPNLIMTEVDKYDKSRGVSRESSPIDQMIARLDSYGDDSRIYGECTVSIAEGRIWSEYDSGTRSKIVVCCPLCSSWVTPERKHLMGWQDAETENQADREAYFACPSCGQGWTDEVRREIMMKCRLVSRTDERKQDEQGHEKWGYQEIVDGIETGAMADTPKFSMRWNAFNNLFWRPGWIGRREWSVARSRDQENSERRMTQFVWAIPYRMDDIEEKPLSPAVLQRRMGEYEQGVAPPDTVVVTAGVDLGKWLGHFVFLAWSPDGGATVIDYGVFDVPSRELGVEIATLAALREFWRFYSEGFVSAGEGDERISPRVVFIDSGYADSQQAVYEFARDHRGVIYASRGYSAKDRKYTHPKKVTKATPAIGVDYHLKFLEDALIVRADVNADAFKSRVQNYLRVGIDQPGAIKVFRSIRRNEHLKFAQHLTAERMVREWVPGKGVVDRWIQESRSNHWLDCICLASAAGHYAGVRVEDAAVDSVDGKTASGPRVVEAGDGDFDEDGRLREHAKFSRL